MNLSEWKETAVQLIKVLRLRGEEAAFRRLLSELYPDEAHFIYELFQNAEDARAKLCRFTLTADALEFEHDGRDLFSEKDVMSITSFGNSTKRDDPTAIGKFGVGFKSVFAYTSTPEIHSGDFHFRIHDLVVPETDGVEKTANRARETRFILPFNHPEKSADKATEEVERGLRALGDNTLLFLSEIRKIEYLLPDGSLGYLERIEHEGGLIAANPEHSDSICQTDTAHSAHWTHIEIQSIRMDELLAASHWLRFRSPITIKDDDGKIIPRHVAVAYKLSHGSSKPGEPRWTIVPVDPGEVSIYFPAAKETSKLRFHLHAPFASTVARDSVRSFPGNDELRDHLAQLIAASIATIRDLGYLDVAFLAVLPNPTDSLSDFYEPICVALVDAFRNSALVPARSGGHVPGSKLSRSPAPIARTLTDRDITILSGREMCLAPNPASDHREDQFLKSLDITEWSWESLNRALSERSRKAIINQWLSHISDENLKALYELLERSLREDRYYDRRQEKFLNHLSVRHLDIVRSRNLAETKMSQVTGSFFQGSQDHSCPSHVYFVLPQYCSGRSKEFLEQIGVKPYDEKIIVRERLERYRNPCGADEQHFDDIKWFIAFAKKYQKETEVFASFAFLLAKSDIDDPIFQRSSGIYIAAPYAETFLQALFENEVDSSARLPKERLPLSTAYLEHGIDPEAILDFAKTIGVYWRLEVNKCTTRANPDYTKLHSGEVKKSSHNDYGREDSDFSMPALVKLLSKPSRSSSLLIWKTMTEHVQLQHLEACYQHNNHSTHNTAPSQVVHQLRNAEWVMQKNGQFVKPSDANPSELPEGFSYDSGSAWLKAIGFGLNEEKKTLRYQALEDVAKSNGLSSAEELSEIVRMIRDAGLTVERIRTILVQHDIQDLPDATVTDPERRRKGLLDEYESLEPRRKVLVERMIDPDYAAVTEDAKKYLRALYKTANDEFFCQCCRQEMPFRYPNGEHYFEAIQCVPSQKPDLHRKRLALCPTCAAMYQHARETEDGEMLRQIRESAGHDQAPFVEIPVRLASRDLNLYFVGKHWFDLKTLLFQ